MKWPSYVVRTSARWCFWWDNSPGNSVSGARALNSSDSSECLWLAIAFMSSTESSVIGYNDQSNINASVSGSAQANADLIWRTERSNHERYNVIVSNITNIIRLFLVYWKLLSKSTWLKNLSQDFLLIEWAWRLCPSWLTFLSYLRILWNSQIYYDL